MKVMVASAETVAVGPGRSWGGAVGVGVVEMIDGAVGVAVIGMTSVVDAASVDLVDIALPVGSTWPTSTASGVCSAPLHATSVGIRSIGAVHRNKPFIIANRPVGKGFEIHLRERIAK